MLCAESKANCLMVLCLENDQYNFKLGANQFTGCTGESNYPSQFALYEIRSISLFSVWD
jgi:hypothetical protein